MTREQVKILVAALGANYRSFQLTTREQVDVWENGLKDIEFHLANKAIEKIMLER